MVVLNLRDDCVARAATNFRRGMTDKRFLELEITAWLGSKERKRQLAGEAYYDGDQDVTRRKRIALDDDGNIKVLEHLPNNRLVHNIYAKMVNQKTNYSFGRPFSLDTENKAYAEAHLHRLWVPFSADHAQHWRGCLDWRQVLGVPLLRPKRGAGFPALSR